MKHLQAVHQPSTESSFPVIEIFGPTIQGEGIDVGRPCYFLRLGYCDFRCAWCDSMHAVDPAQVKENVQWLSVQEIVYRLNSLPGHHRDLVISGGNPAMWDLTPVLQELANDSSRMWRVAVETQGTVWRDWLGKVDLLVVSPKPPSSKMTVRNLKRLPDFLEKAYDVIDEENRLIVKIVVFNPVDLEFAYEIATTYHLDNLWLSCGTKPDDTSEALLRRYRNLVADSLEMFDDGLTAIRVLPQTHVLLWGHKKGV